RTLHVDEPTPHVDWASGGVRLLREARRWPARARDGGPPRRAGVSGFAISGTNAHVIIEEAPDDVDAWREGASVPGEPRVVRLVVSAGSREALAAQAGRLAADLEGRAGLGLGDVGWSLATSRAALTHRSVVVAADQEAALAGLGALATDAAAGNV